MPSEPARLPRLTAILDWTIFVSGAVTLAVAIFATTAGFVMAEDRTSEAPGLTAEL